MYAAAGGASLAKNRQRKALNVKNKALLSQGLKDKLAAAKVSNLPVKQTSRQFHNLPSSYLRTPQAHVRKLSAGYTTQSKILVPINESNNQYFAHHHGHREIQHPNAQYTNPNQSIHKHSTAAIGSDSLNALPSNRHHHHHHHHHIHSHAHSSSNRPISRRPSSVNLSHPHKKLTKSATASIPLVSQYELTSPESPACLFKNHLELETDTIAIENKHEYDAIGHKETIEIKDNINVPCIITPATPLASPGPTDAEQFERKCSFYRGREQLTFDETIQTFDNNKQCDEILITIGHDDSAHYDDEYHTMHGIKTCNIEKWTDSECCDSEHHSTCDHIECAQGRAAWLERGRRCSISDNAASCHRRWVKRNRIHDSSLGSSDDGDILGGIRGPSSFANAFLYVGLGTVALGLVILFVGTGEKGFKTMELRMIGPSLIGVGLTCCILRIFFCICPSHCLSRREKLKKKNAKVDADHTTSLLQADSKRVSIAKNAQTIQPPTAQNSMKKHPNSKMLEGMEALRQMASTSLFIQNEKVNSDSMVPTIREHIIAKETPMELKRVDEEITVFSLNDTEDNDILVKLTNETPTTLQSKPSHKINDNNSTNSMSVSSPMKPIQPEQQNRQFETSTSGSSHQQPRTSKLSRTRAPINQQKSKPEPDLTLMTLDTLQLSKSNDVSNSSKTNTTLSLTPSIASSSFAQFNSNNQNPFRSISMSMSTNNSQSIPLKPIIQDGNAKITTVQPATVTMTQTPTTMASTVTVTNIPSAISKNISSSFEPELVLSPAKLGQ